MAVHFVENIAIDFCEKHYFVSPAIKLRCILDLPQQRMFVDYIMVPTFVAVSV